MAEKYNYLRGSEWRKWDLHVHTPASYDWDKGSKISEKELVETAIKSGLSAIAVTDHHSVDWIDKVKAEGDKLGLLVIPGVELRTDKGNKGIHIIGLFDPNISAKTIYDKVLCPLGLSESDRKSTGDEQIYCDFEEACEKINDIHGLVFLHAGQKASGIEDLDSDIRSTLKRDLASLVDIFEVTNQKQVDDYRKIVFPKIKQEFPCLVTSDSIDRKSLKFKRGHSLDGLGKAFSWIKADLTFWGLVQIIAEPTSRIFLGTEPPKLLDVRNHPSHYIESLEVTSTSGSNHHWFDSKILLSSGLTAIIGKKGSGKSAFVDILALTGKSHVDQKHYSFLHPNKFRRTHAIAKKYTASLIWTDGESIVESLDNVVNSLVEPERVKYLPQQFVEEICNENGVSDLFQKEIEKVIFSYIPEEKHLGAQTLEELINLRGDKFNLLVGTLRSDIENSNAVIVALETKKNKNYKEKIENELKELQKQLKAIKDPKAISEPKEKLPKEQAEKIESIKNSLIEVEEDIRLAKEESKDTNRKLVAVERIEGKISSIEENVGKTLDMLNDEAKLIGLKVKEVIKFQIDRKQIEEKRKEFEKIQKELDKKLSLTEVDPKISLFAKKASLEKSQKEITDSSTEQHKKYQEYLRQKKQAEASRNAILGNSKDDGLNTVFSLEEEIKYINLSLDNDLMKAYSNRTSFVKKLTGVIIGKIDLYKEIYSPLIDFIEQEKLEQRKTGNMLTFDAGIVFDKVAFSEGFLSYINQGRDGSFQSKDAGTKRLNDIVNSYSFQNIDEPEKLANELLENLRSDLTKPTPTENDLLKQLNNGMSSKQLYDFLFKIEYLDVKFKILFNGKDLNENVFSPGEKGALLLIFYLLIDKEKIPLIMDQPEENLDNESVFKLLVPYIKKGKENQQIIIVTHNPNLAVVCDAEQVISASMDKKKNEIRYTSGSIENPKTNQEMVNILEGTMPAFSKRDQRYIR